MKKKLTWGVVLFLAIGLVLFNYTRTLTGRYFTTGGTIHYIIVDDKPIQMLVENDSIFEDIGVGDLIKVVYDGHFNESYPSQTGVSFCFLVENGTDTDIPTHVIDTFVISENE